MTQRTATPESVPTVTTVQLPTTIGSDVSDRVFHFHFQRGDMHVSGSSLSMFGHVVDSCLLGPQT